MTEVFSGRVRFPARELFNQKGRFMNNGKSCPNCGKKKEKPLNDFCSSCQTVLDKLPKEFQNEMKAKAKIFQMFQAGNM